VRNKYDRASSVRRLVGPALPLSHLPFASVTIRLSPIDCC
jgi:hypothetical protein